MRSALALMLGSGFAGLSYQVVWTQQCALWLGHEAAAVLAVVAAFFGGLALGALALGRIARSAVPARWYAGCEALIAAWSLVLALALPQMAPLLLAAIGDQPHPAWQWTTAFTATFVLLLPATAAMGATLPAMTRLRAAWCSSGDSVGNNDTRGKQNMSSGIGALYAANTAGAVLGVLACAFWLLPGLGLVTTAALCAALNLACAAAALALGGAPAPSSPVAPQHDAAIAAAGRGVLATLALTGLLGIGYEVLVVRVLSQVAEDTVYTFALLLAVYLVGSAAGAAAWQRWWQSRGGAAQDAPRLRRRLLLLQAASCLAGIAALWAAEDLHAAVRTALGGGMPAALAAEAALALAAFALPTVAMGALFSHLAEEAHAAGLGVARALGVNTLGAAAAPLLFGVLLVPAIGPKLALLLVAAGYLALARRPRARSQRAAWGLTVAAAAGLALWAPPLAFVAVPEGGRIVSYRDGALAAVSVVEDAGGVSRLRIDNRQQEGSSATRFADARQALLPLLLLERAPERALFLGLGTGITASSAAEADPSLQVDAVELLPEVIAASQHFIGDGIRHPNLRLTASDARRHVKTSSAHYGLIVADNFHPARSGSGSLYTVEHFAAVRARLNADGLFCQWLPLHQLDLATLRSIVRSFRAAFPATWALLATNSLETPVIGLVGRADDHRRFSLQALHARLAAWPADARARHGLPDALALAGGFVAGPQALSAFAGDAPLNTDDRPVVAYRAPRITYAPDSLPRDRLLALIGELRLSPEEVFADGDAALQARVAAYWQARDRYLRAGRDVQPSANAERMLAQVREPLLGVLRTSADFRPARDPLLRLAAAVEPHDPAAAQALRAEIARLAPLPPPFHSLVSP